MLWFLAGHGEAAQESPFHSDATARVGCVQAQRSGRLGARASPSEQLAPHGEPVDPLPSCGRENAGKS
jgi:hypothetical protein